MIVYKLSRVAPNEADRSVEISNRQLDLIYAALADYKENLQYNGEDFDTMDELARAENEVEDLFSTLYEIVKV